MKKFSLQVLICLTSLTCQATQSDINFFISQGAVYSTDNNIAGSDSGLSLKKREIGASGVYEINKNIEVRGMTVVEKYGNRYNDDIHFEYALADIHSNSEYGVYGVRFGRVKNTMGMFNDNRSNPAIREMDFPPQSLYRDQMEHSAISGDGIQAYYGYTFNSGNSLDLEVSKFNAELYPEEDYTNTLLNLPQGFGKFTDNAAHSYHIQYKMPNDGIIVKYDNITLNFTYNAIIPIVPSGKLNTNIQYLSVRKYIKNIDLTAELVHVSRSGSTWDDVLRNKNYGSPIGANFVVQHRKDNWSIFTGYNFWYTDIKDKSGKIHEQNTGISRNRYYHKDINFGFKYKFNKNIVFKSEFHHIKGTNVLSIIENPVMNTLKPSWNLYSASITYTF